MLSSSSSTTTTGLMIPKEECSNNCSNCCCGCSSPLTTTCSSTRRRKRRLKQQRRPTQHVVDINQTMNSINPLSSSPQLEEESFAQRRRKHITMNNHHRHLRRRRRQPLITIVTTTTTTKNNHRRRPFVGHIAVVVALLVGVIIHPFFTARSVHRYSVNGFTLPTFGKLKTTTTTTTGHHQQPHYKSASPRINPSLLPLLAQTVTAGTTSASTSRTPDVFIPNTEPTLSTMTFPFPTTTTTTATTNGRPDLWTMTMDSTFKTSSSSPLSSSSSVLPPSMLLSSRNSFTNSNNVFHQHHQQQWSSSSPQIMMDHPNHLRNDQQQQRRRGQRPPLGFDVFELDSTRQPQQEQEEDLVFDEHDHNDVNDDHDDNPSQYVLPRQRNTFGSSEHSEKVGGRTRRRIRRNRNNSGMRHRWKNVKVDLDVQAWDDSAGMRSLVLDDNIDEFDDIESYVANSNINTMNGDQDYVDGDHGESDNTSDDNSSSDDTSSTFGNGPSSHWFWDDVDEDDDDDNDNYIGSNSNRRFFPSLNVAGPSSILRSASVGTMSSLSSSSSSFNRITPSSSSTTTPTRSFMDIGPTADSTTNKQSSILPAWFPWIPTKSQIHSLKVTELKVACGQRGLVKTGNKADLQDRLWEWTNEHQYQHQLRITGDYLTNWFEDMAYLHPDAAAFKSLEPSTESMDISTNATTADDKVGTNNDNVYNDFGFPTIPTTEKSGGSTPNSLAEWSRTVDLDKLLEKRKEIHRRKREGKKHTNPNRAIKQDRKSLSTAEGTRAYLAKLTKTIQSSPSSPYASNKDVQEIYEASKKADQLGDIELAISLLKSLLDITPKDGRVYRRLSRLHNDHGDVEAARSTLQNGIRLMPDNAWLWHGLGQLEVSNGRTGVGIKCYQRAIKEDPSFAHSYHAWGTYEHSQGQIARAMKILKKGVEYNPTNHRLHHALGDIYQDAGMLEDADRSYRRALREGPPISHSFAFSALACVSYELGDVDETRRWLKRSIQSSHGRHCNSWLALAQLEEAEGNPATALELCRLSIDQYEKELINRSQRFKRKNGSGNLWNRRNGREGLPPVSTTTSEDTKKALLDSIPVYRPGDKFINVFRHWLRLENEFGTTESADEVYERASIAFPGDFRLALQFADYQESLRHVSRARHLYAEACSKASNGHAEPFWKSAVFEMKLGNYQQAQKVLFRGAQSVSKSPDGGLIKKRDMTELFVTWALCERHLGNMDRAEKLFDDALRLTEVGEEGAAMRSFILFCVADLEYTERNELLLAQHCIGLCLKEGKMPFGNTEVWRMWADVANDMENTKLSAQCEGIASTCEKNNEGLSPSLPLTAADLIKQSRITGRWQPWQEKLQTQKGRKGLDASYQSASFFYKVRFLLPRYKREVEESEEENLFVEQ